MTATPIPRTLSLTLFGDLDISVIDELPPGRTPVETRWSAPGASARRVGFSAPRGRRRAPGLRRLSGDRAIEIGRGAALAESRHRRIRAAAEIASFRNLRLGLLHGRMRSDEKEAVMEGFRRGEVHILVSTTVIEVGVDVPNATVMVIEHAERFGLAQLHQLRGRIGRGGREEHLHSHRAENVRAAKRTQRLETMVATNDGFAIAETDLKLRGPGEFFGTRQHGALGLHVANPLRDRELLELARREAFALVRKPRSRSGAAAPAGSLDPEWQRRYQLASVG